MPGFKADYIMSLINNLSLQNQRQLIIDLIYIIKNNLSKQKARDYLLNSALEASSILLFESVSSIKSTSTILSSIS